MRFFIAGDVAFRIFKAGDVAFRIFKAGDVAVQRLYGGWGWGYGCGENYLKIFFFFLWNLGGFGLIMIKTIIMEKYKNKYRVASARHPNWEYRNNAAYFITICTFDKEYYFGDCKNAQMRLSTIGAIIQGF